MFRYLLKRVLIAGFTLWVISLVAFFLTSIAPGDAVMCGREEWSEDAYGSIDYEISAKRLGLDKPLFYFSLHSLSHPDTLHRYLSKDKKESLTNLVAQYGNWEATERYHHSIENCWSKIASLSDTIPSQFVNPVRNTCGDLRFQYKDNKIVAFLTKLEIQIAKDAALAAQLGNEFKAIQSSYQTLTDNPTRWKLYVPSLAWHGFDNQYHNWFSGFLSGDFGISCTDSRPVIDKIKWSLWWTVVMSIAAIILAFLIAIPIGVYAATQHGKIFDRWSGAILFLLYSLPSFWVATLMVVFFTTAEYGEWTNIFASIGLGQLSSSAPFWDRFWEAANHLILPILCITYPALAVISRQMRGGMITVLRQDYIRTAKAKGLSQTQVIWKHAFRNGLFPIITLFANAFPAAVGGSVVIEVIFNIHGMGLTTFNAINAQDWPVVYAIMMLGAVLTILGILIADLCYVWADPRVTFENRKL